MNKYHIVSYDLKPVKLASKKFRKEQTKVQSNLSKNKKKKKDQSNYTKSESGLIFSIYLFIYNFLKISFCLDTIISLLIFNI